MIITPHYKYILRIRRSQVFSAFSHIIYCIGGTMEVFCNRLKELRKEKGITTIQLGDALKVSNSTISRWESGDILPSIYHLYNLSLYFKVSADYLIGLTDWD